MRKFAVSRKALVTYRNGFPQQHLISAWIRAQQTDDEPPFLTMERVDSILQLPRLSVPEKQLRLLRHIASKTEDPGLPVVIDFQNDPPVAHAKSSRELKYLIGELGKRGYSSQEQAANDVGLIVRTAGWEYLEEQGKRAKHQQAFVAMSFDTSMTGLWTTAIHPGVRLAGYQSYRVDQEPHIDRIDARIIAAIRDSSFVIADVTMHKHGVYYEAGFAQGLGLPVIWMVRESDLPGVHFDTRQYAHIMWNAYDDAREKLTNAILAVMGRGPLRTDEQQRRA